MNFFNTENFKDIGALRFYLSTRTEDAVRSDLRSSNCDPNDVLTIGDMAFFMLKNDTAARIFYEESLRTLDARPGLVAPDIQPVHAKRNLCAIYVSENQLQKAIQLVASSPDVIDCDLNLANMLAFKLHRSGESKLAFPLIRRIMEFPESVIVEKIQIPISGMRAFYSEVRAQAAVMRMKDLKWFWPPEAKPVPDGLLTMRLDVLSAKGLPASILQSLRSAVIMTVSTDRRMWFVFFYNVEDPRDLLKTKGAQTCFASFSYYDGEVQLADVSW